MRQTKPKDEAVFDTCFEASVGFIKMSCRGAVRIGLKPIAASHFRLFFLKKIFQQARRKPENARHQP